MLLRGDVDGFGVLIDAHWGSMYRLARLVGDPASARATVRAAWAAAIDEADERPPELSMRGWLLGIVIERLEPSTTSPRDPLPAAVSPGDLEDGRWAGHWKDGLPAPAPAGAEAVETVLARLPAGVAAVVLLRDVERLREDEVARLLSRSPEEQRALLHEGRTGIRNLLEATS